MNTVYRSFLVVVAAALAAALLLLSFVSNHSPKEVSVHLWEYDLSNLKRSELLPFLELVNKDWLSQPFQVKVQNKSFLFPKKELGWKLNLVATRKAILEATTPQVTPVFDYDPEATLQWLQELARETMLPPKDASRLGNKIIRGQTEKSINAEAALQKITQAIKQGKSEVELTLVESRPPRKNTEQVLEEIGCPYLLASFQTSCQNKEEGALFNIQKAAQSIDGLIIERDKLFSFNEVVGEAGKEDGYREAPVFVNGNLSTGFGGGICQVVSTLYNALLLTEAQIIERHPHSGYYPETAYVPPGRDAAVSYGYKDFRFRFANQKVVIFAEVDENQMLTVSIWGEKENHLRRSFKTEVLATQKAEEGKAFLTVCTTVFENGNSLFSYQDTYLTSEAFAKELSQTY